MINVKKSGLSEAELCIQKALQSGPGPNNFRPDTALLRTANKLNHLKISNNWTNAQVAASLATGNCAMSEMSVSRYIRLVTQDCPLVLDAIKGGELQGVGRAAIMQGLPYAVQLKLLTQARISKSQITRASLDEALSQSASTNPRSIAKRDDFDLKAEYWATASWEFGVGIKMSQANRNLQLIRAFKLNPGLQSALLELAISSNKSVAEVLADQLGHLVKP